MFGQNQICNIGHDLPPKDSFSKIKYEQFESSNFDKNLNFSMFEIGQIENLDNFECLKLIKNHVCGFKNSNKITIFDNVEKDYLDLGNCICHTKVGTTEFES